MTTQLSKCRWFARLLAVLAVLVIPVLAMNFVATFAAENGQIQAVYDLDWQLRYYLKENTLYSLDWQIEYYVKDDSVFDKGWIKRYYLRDNTLYDSNWHRRYYIKEFETPKSVGK